jgi:uncharacterized nucleotidyltransferase DUF6036
MNLDATTLEHALEMLGQVLADREQHYEVVAIGGGSLLLLKQMDRMTKDLDLVALVQADQFISADPLPGHLLVAIEEVALALQLRKDWVNPGPTSLLELGLPQGFKDRIHTRQYGALTIHFAGRFDQICFKLYASVDHGPKSKHFADLKQLLPNLKELQMAKQWCITHDISPAFATMLDQAIAALGELNAVS